MYETLSLNETKNEYKPELPHVFCIKCVDSTARWPIQLRGRKAKALCGTIATAQGNGWRWQSNEETCVVCLDLAQNPTCPNGHLFLVGRS